MEYMKWFPLIPYIMAHPKIIALLQELPEAQLLVSDLMAVLNKPQHAAFIQRVEAEEPEIIALANQLAPIIKQIQGE